MPDDYIPQLPPASTPPTRHERTVVAGPLASQHARAQGLRPPRDNRQPITPKAPGPVREPPPDEDPYRYQPGDEPEVALIKAEHRWASTSDEELRRLLALDYDDPESVAHHIYREEWLLTALLERRRASRQ